MNLFKAGDKVAVKTTGKQATVVAASGEYVLVRTISGVQWTYTRDELEALPE